MASHHQHDCTIVCRNLEDCNTYKAPTRIAVYYACVGPGSQGRVAVVRLEGSEDVVTLIFDQPVVRLYLPSTAVAWHVLVVSRIMACSSSIRATRAPTVAA